ncbi:hypothetical protein CSB62_20900 [Vibrio splendidus]|nr:hypothetical protein [Vibrio lentus]PHN84031.1 hypothetical protein CSB62_20900 [Vibrio splendidus]MCC4783974.1 hypothetical protein [Vibrio lentus]MCC4854263.1 hypothetical protein [Vibrio lentus]PME62471.1 hypothetical protein BCV33_03890 [Vibrio lentus]PMG56726.1 hypothetical protein BCU87_22895 [Vibrio lentus]
MISKIPSCFYAAIEITLQKNFKFSRFSQIDWGHNFLLTEYPGDYLDIYSINSDVNRSYLDHDSCEIYSIINGVYNLELKRISYFDVEKFIKKLLPSDKAQLVPFPHFFLEERKYLFPVPSLHMMCLRVIDSDTFELTDQEGVVQVNHKTLLDAFEWVLNELGTLNILEIDFAPKRDSPPSLKDFEDFISTRITNYENYGKKNLELLKSFLDEKTKKNPLHVDHPSRVWTICLARSSEIDFINRYKNMDFKISNISNLLKNQQDLWRKTSMLILACNKEPKASTNKLINDNIIRIIDLEECYYSELRTIV